MTSTIVTGPRRARTLPGVLGAALALLLAAGCSPAPQDAAAGGEGTSTVRVGPLQDPNYLTLTRLAGSMEETVGAAGGEVEWAPAFPAFAPTAEALRGGSIDIGTGSSTSFLSALGEQSDLVVFAVEQDSGLGQGIVGRDGVATVEDLVGRTVAVNRGGTGEYLLLLALREHGIDPSTVDIQYLPPTEAATAFAQGHVDAWAVWDQFYATAQTVPGAQVVASGRDIGSVNRIVHVTTRAFADANPELLRAAYDALARESDAASSDNSRIADLAAEGGAPPEVAEVIRAVPPATIAPADQALLAEFTSIAEFYAETGLAEPPADVSAAVVDVLGGSS
ncbi:hypothetical protein GCM10009613_04930 [Pseudonocardia kongjuensis]|uniref:SsuA/THI5-like domain-containing protein n=1 Tax=Pseudonocardia kongjuensis TaxID=102227 RepID=A0ABN1XG82_9PSEU